MSAMRKRVMQRSHRKSISEVDKDLKNDNKTLDGTTTRETPGLPSTSSARTRSRRTRNKKSSKKQVEEKENDLPVAQSTLINDSHTSNSHLSNAEKVTNQLLEMTENVENIGQINNNEEATKDGKALTDKTYIKMTTQEAADQFLEFKLKYERLCGVVEQFKEQHFQLLQNYQNLQAEKKEVIGRMKDDLYKLESEKFSLQEELETTKVKLAKLEEKKDEEANQSKINASKHELSIVSNPSEPLSRTRRKSMLNENVSSMVKDDSEKCAFYEDIILDQQDILDFYSLLCSSSICKQPTEGSSDEVDEDNPPTEMKYSCKIQLKNHLLDGFPFEFTLNYQTKELEYLPTTTELYQEHLPCNLQTRKIYNADEASLFVKEIADLLQHKNDKD